MLHKGSVSLVQQEGEVQIYRRICSLPAGPGSRLQHGQPVLGCWSRPTQHQLRLLLRTREPQGPQPRYRCSRASPAPARSRSVHNTA